MRPIIKKKRIDPRYFLDETADRDKLDEIEPNPSPQEDDVSEEEECGSVTVVKKTDDEKKPKKKGGEKSAKKGDGRKILFGEKDLHTVVREAIEEFFAESDYHDARIRRSGSDPKGCKHGKTKEGYCKMSDEDVKKEKARAARKGLKRVDPDD